MAKDKNYDKNVLAHIALHKSKGETEALKAHMASPIHKAIVKAAANVKATVEPDDAPDAPDDGDQKDPDEGKDKE